MTDRVLIGDIGGTNARFAMAAGGQMSQPVKLKVADYPSSLAALTAAAGHLGCSEYDRIRLAIAGVVHEGEAALTNGDWIFDASDISRAFSGSPVQLFNDVQAAALALPHLDSKALTPLGGGDVDQTKPFALLMVGTGLGVSCCLPAGEQSLALATEAGHATLAVTTEPEEHILRCLRERFGHVSAERVLSGGGLSLLHNVMTGGEVKTQVDIVADALSGAADDAAVLEQFCAFLGSVAGSLALAYGAWGGVFIGGGIPPRFKTFLAQSSFRDRFEAKGRFTGRLQSVPTMLVSNDDLALVGLVRHP